MEGTTSLILRRKGETDGFGERFGSEIPNGSLLFIEGKEGVGKSIFCQRFCTSILGNGHTCSYVSTQFTIKSFLRQTMPIYEGPVLTTPILHGHLVLPDLETAMKLADEQVLLPDNLVICDSAWQKNTNQV